jgi:putative ABC transport system ATP-binding protein
MIRLFNVRKVYSQGKNEVCALAGLSLNIPEGEFAVIMGPSGSGKSTLLHLMGGLDRPTEGEVMVAGRIISQMLSVLQPPPNLVGPGERDAPFDIG